MLSFVLLRTLAYRTKASMHTAPPSIALTVFMPAFNESANLPHTVPALIAALHNQVRCAPTFELIIVNDGSSDDTGQIADQLAAHDPHIRVIHQPVNRGIGLGFVAAMTAALGEWFILIPADLAMQLEELPKYFEAVRDDEADIVVGHRSDRADYSPLRRLISVINIGLIRLLFKMEQQQFNYISLYRSQCLRQMTLRYTDSALFYAEILVYARAQGYKLVNVWINYVPREHGLQTGSNWRLVVKTVRDIMAFWLRWTFKGAG